MLQNEIIKGGVEFNPFKLIPFHKTQLITAIKNVSKFKEWDELDVLIDLNENGCFTKHTFSLEGLVEISTIDILNKNNKINEDIISKVKYQLITNIDTASFFRNNINNQVIHGN